MKPGPGLILTAPLKRRLLRTFTVLAFVPRTKVHCAEEATERWLLTIKAPAATVMTGLIASALVFLRAAWAFQKARLLPMPLVETPSKVTRFAGAELVKMICAL